MNYGQLNCSFTLDLECSQGAHAPYLALYNSDVSIINNTNW